MNPSKYEKSIQPDRFPFRCACNKIVTKSAWVYHNCNKPILSNALRVQLASERWKSLQEEKKLYAQSNSNPSTV